MNSTKTYLQHIQPITSTSVVIKAKIKGPYLRWSPLLPGCELPSAPVLCCESTASFPHALLVPTSTLNIPLNSHFHTCDIFNQQKMTSTGWIFSCPEQELYFMLECKVQYLEFKL
jgi:hypothetical protein